MTKDTYIVLLRGLAARFRLRQKEAKADAEAAVSHDPPAKDCHFRKGPSEGAYYRGREVAFATSANVIEAAVLDLEDT